MLPITARPQLRKPLHRARAAHAEAADLRVDAASGDDTAANAEVAAGTASWATIGRAAWGSTDRNTPNAAEAAQPGDTVTVAAGIYSAANMSGTRYEPAFNPVNGADSASWGRVESYAGSSPTWRSSAATLRSSMGWPLRRKLSPD